MADIRIKDLATTASTTASDDFLAVDGTTNGTRKLSAATPSFATSVTVPGVAGPTATNLTLTGGSTGASLVLGQGATAANVTLNATTSGFLSFTKSEDSITPSLARFLNAGATTAGRYNEVIFGKSLVNGGAGTLGYKSDTATPANSRLFIVHYGNNQDTGGIQITNVGNLLIGGTTDITGSGGLKVFGATAASSTTTGALQVAGGVGVAGASYFGSQVTAARPFMSTGAITANMTSAGGFGFSGGGTNFYSFGANASTSGSFAFQSVSSDASINFNALTLAAGTGAATFAGAVTVSSTTAGSAGAGALVVSGGLATGAASYFGGAVSVAGATTAAAGAIGVTSADPSLRFKATGSVVADQNTYEIRNVGSTSNTYLQFRTVNDANSVFTTRMALWNSGGLYLGNSGAFADPGAANLWIEGAFRGTQLTSPSGTALTLGTTSFGTALTFASATGAATFSGAVAINNTTAAAVAAPSTHKVSILIGGVQYYLLASNV